MAESARRRPSKWDLKEEPNSLQKEIRQDSAWPVKTSQSFHDQGSNMENKYSKGSGPNWSDMEPDRGVQPKDNSGGSFLKSSSGSRRELKDGDFNRYSREISESRNKRARDESYSMSPRTDRWRRRSRSRSPKNGWSRSRSRSPSRGFRRESEGRNDRVRGGSGVSASTCRDYVGGRCSRGSQCRFLHQDDHDNAGRKHSGGDSAENWSSRHERGGSSENNLERDYSRCKNSHGDGHHYDGNLEKHEAPKNSRSSNLCNHFLKGRCYKGSSCIYSHDTALADAHGTRESSYKSWDENASFGADSRQPRRRISEVPCKFFAVGNCRNGVSCKFSHDNAAHDDRSEEKSRESRWASNLENENRSWGGSKWSNEAAASAEGRQQNVHWGRNLEHDRSEAKSRDSRWGTNLDSENRSWEGSKWSNEAADSADGRQQNVIWGQNLDNDRSEEKSKDSKWGSNLEIENRLQEGPQWSKGAVDSAEGWPAWGEKAVNTDAPQFQEWRNDAAGTKMGDKAENNSWGGSKWIDKAAPEVTKSPQWRKNEDGVKTDVPVLQPADRWGHNSDDQNRNLGAPQSDKPDGLASHASSQWVGGNTSGSMGIWASKGAGELLHAGNMPPADPKGNEYPHFPDNGGLHNQHLQSFNQKEHTLSFSEQTMSGEVLSQQHHALPILQPAISESMHIQQQWSLTGTAATFPLENIDGVTNGVKQQNEASVSEGKLTTIIPVHEQSYSLKENLVSQPVSSFNVEGQGIHPSPTPSVQTFDLNGPSQEMISHKFSSPHLPTPAHVGETIQRSDMVGQKMSPTNTGHPLAQKIVTSEQAAQITNLSASLAQIFANGQQLPQLYASLNASHSKGLLPCHPNSAGPVAPVAASFAQSNQDFWHQAQYNPIAERTNSSDISVRPPGFPLANPIELNKTSGQESQIAVTSISKSNSGGTVAPVAASFAQSNQDFWHQAQYNPIAERTNLSDISARTPGFPLANPIELNKTSEQESQIAVTSISKSNSAGPVAPVAASFAQSNQDIWHQAQYNPIAERTNLSDISVCPPGFPLANPMELNKTSEQESQIPVTSFAPSSIIGEPKKPSADGLEKTFHHRSLESKQSQPVDDGRALSETIKERENAHPEDMNADGQVDDEGKKNKDPKGMRMFKFAVVEFVKEILKPTWKEGQMSKEAHKTIVKKVVDKVTGSHPVEQIPQTQERIDHYLSCSKSKLTKLVQGYVEKYLKS